MKLFQNTGTDLYFIPYKDVQMAMLGSKFEKNLLQQVR